MPACAGLVPFVVAALRKLADGPWSPPCARLPHVRVSLRDDRRGQSLDQRQVGGVGLSSRHMLHACAPK